MSERERRASNPVERESAAARRLTSLWEVSFGDAALAAFVLCALSGVLLLPAFDARDGLRSIGQWLLANPGATVLRNLHYWTAQAFLVLTALHAWDHLRRRSEGRLARSVWLRLVASLPVLAFLMLSGFLLRGDADAQQARRILEEMLALLPLVGRALAQFLLGSEGASLQVVFLQHAATATAIVWLVVVEHARRTWGGVRAIVLASAGCGALALLVSPGLHDGLHEAIKGPWYFLGLQELLHWSSWPAWLLLAGAAALALLAWIPDARPTTAARAKRALYAAVVLYFVLCLGALFARGAHWSLAPAWPGGPGDLRAGPLLERVTMDAAKAALPVVLGRPEGCLACHGGMTGFSPAHKPEAVGCASCHGGDTFTLDAARAHRGMLLVPGNIADAARSCGQGACHADIVPRVERSIMATFAGVIATDRLVFGEDPHAGAAPGQPPHARQLGHSAADSHLRQMCVGCHLDQGKTLWGPIDQRSRGGGCNACHLNYSPEAKAALDTYMPAVPARSDGGARVPPPPSGRPFPRVHPRLSVQASGEHCFGCHSRSSRISTSYEGWHEMRHAPDDDARRNHAERYRRLQDGRTFERKTADVHHSAGMDCIDCHTALEVMGSGHSVAHKAQALRVRCEDCHAAPGGRLASRDAKDIDPESRKILTLRGWTHPPGLRVGATRSGDTLLNVTVDAAGRGTLRRKGDGGTAPLKPQAGACSGDRAHERLSCNSCHTAWTPQCTSCHTRFDPQSEGRDYLDRKFVHGQWIEESERFDAGPPALGVRRANGQGERGGESVDTFVPGMVMTLDRNTRAGAPADPVFRRLFAPSAAHTTQRTSRSCTACHNDPVALGYGQGTLKFEPDPVPVATRTAARAAAGRSGRWRFTPQEATLPQDGLPADAWTGFLAARADRASTQDGARPFGVAEQQRILTVGACLTCHQGDSAPMRAGLRDFANTLQQRTAQCAAPVWK
jgi:hypothetical protein